VSIGYIQAGYDHLILLQIGPDQDDFFGFFERELAPALRNRAAARAPQQQGPSQPDYSPSRTETYAS
jgi:hypothetical protein